MAIDNTPQVTNKGTPGASKAVGDEGHVIGPWPQGRTNSAGDGANGGIITMFFSTSNGYFEWEHMRNSNFGAGDGVWKWGIPCVFSCFFPFKLLYLMRTYENIYYMRKWCSKRKQGPVPTGWFETKGTSCSKLDLTVGSYLWYYMCFTCIYIYKYIISMGNWDVEAAEWIKLQS